MVQAGVYSAILHYLKAVDALKSAARRQGGRREMKELPTDDPLFGKGADSRGRPQIHPAYLFEVKKPERIEIPLATITSCVATIPRIRPSVRCATSECPLVK